MNIKFIFYQFDKKNEKPLQTYPFNLTFQNLTFVFSQLMANFKDHIVKEILATNKEKDETIAKYLKLLIFINSNGGTLPWCPNCEKSRFKFQSTVNMWKCDGCNKIQCDFCEAGSVFAMHNGGYYAMFCGQCDRNKSHKKREEIKRKIREEKGIIEN